MYVCMYLSIYIYISKEICLCTGMDLHLYTCRFTVVYKFIFTLYTCVFTYTCFRFLNK